VKPCLSARGFTLLELLVTLLILGTVMSVIMACFDGGFRVYERISLFGSGEMNVHLAGEQIQQDLGSPMIPGNAVFDKDRVEFRRIADGVEDLVSYHPGTADRPGGLVRTQSRQGGDQTANSEILLGAPFRVLFEYAGTNRSENSRQEQWADVWTDTTNLPRAVRMRVRPADPGSEEMVRTIPLRGQ
jgi:prepilin-type N-terminal cleavage/methylation domain-containing protein